MKLIKNKTKVVMEESYKNHHNSPSPRYKIPRISIPRFAPRSFNPSPFQPYSSQVSYHSFVGKEIKYSDDILKACTRLKIVPEKINEMRKEILSLESQASIFDMVNDYQTHQLRSILRSMHRLAFTANYEFEILENQLKQQEEKIKSLEENISEKEAATRKIILNKRNKKKMKSARRRQNLRDKLQWRQNLVQLWPPPPIDNDEYQDRDSSESVMEINTLPSLTED